jgi:hypothetical protein
MKPWTRWVYAIAGLAAVLVAVSSIVLALRQDSWAPVIAVCWIPAVVVAAWPGLRRRRRPSRRGPRWVTAQRRYRTRCAVCTRPFERCLARGPRIPSRSGQERVSETQPVHYEITVQGFLDPR